MLNDGTELYDPHPLCPGSALLNTAGSGPRRWNTKAGDCQATWTASVATFKARSSVPYLSSTKLMSVVLLSDSTIMCVHWDRVCFTLLCTQFAYQAGGICCDITSSDGPFSAYRSGSRDLVVGLDLGASVVGFRKCGLMETPGSGLFKSPHGITENLKMTLNTWRTKAKSNSASFVEFWWSVLIKGETSLWLSVPMYNVSKLPRNVPSTSCKNNKLLTIFVGKILLFVFNKHISRYSQIHLNQFIDCRKEVWNSYLEVGTSFIFHAIETMDYNNLKSCWRIYSIAIWLHHNHVIFGPFSYPPPDPNFPNQCNLHEQALDNCSMNYAFTSTLFKGCQADRSWEEDLLRYPTLQCQAFDKQNICNVTLWAPYTLWLPRVANSWSYQSQDSRWHRIAQSAPRPLPVSIILTQLWLQAG